MEAGLLFGKIKVFENTDSRAVVYIRIGFHKGISGYGRYADILCTHTKE